MRSLKSFRGLGQLTHGVAAKAKPLVPPRHAEAFHSGLF